MSSSSQIPVHQGRVPMMMNLHLSLRYPPPLPISPGAFGGAGCVAVAAPIHAPFENVFAAPLYLRLEKHVITRIPH